MISQYCRLYHQTKPFSHIAIDLFKEVIEKSNVKPTNPKYEEHKSDTDSGRSSIHEREKELSNKCEDIILPTKYVANQLRVTRCTDDKLKALNQLKVTPVNVIGYENEPSLNDNETKTIEQPVGGNCLQVISRKNAILKRRNLHRRNTIDVSQFKLERNDNAHLNASKSTNCLNKLESRKTDEFIDRISQMNFIGSSMPGEFSLAFIEFLLGTCI